MALVSPHEGPQASSTDKDTTVTDEIIVLPSSNSFLHEAQDGGDILFCHQKNHKLQSKRARALFKQQSGRSESRTIHRSAHRSYSFSSLTATSESDSSSGHSAAAPLGWSETTLLSSGTSHRHVKRSRSGSSSSDYSESTTVTYSSEDSCGEVEVHKRSCGEYSRERNSYRNGAWLSDQQQTGSWEGDAAAGAGKVRIHNVAWRQQQYLLSEAALPCETTAKTGVEARSDTDHIVLATKQLQLRPPQVYRPAHSFPSGTAVSTQVRLPTGSTRCAPSPLQWARPVTMQSPDLALTFRQHEGDAASCLDDAEDEEVFKYLNEELGSWM